MTTPATAGSLDAWIRSVVRTVVPGAVASASVWLACKYAITLPANTEMLAVTLVLAAYYGAVRWLEARWPIAGVLLGWPTAPAYTPDTPATVDIEARARELAASLNPPG